MIYFRPHIVHAHTPLPLPLAVIAKVLRVKVVITIHGTDFLTLRRSRLLQLVFRVFSDKIFYVSTAMREPLFTMFPETKLAYTPSGVDLKLFRHRGLYRKRQLISVGSLKWQKGYQDLLKAFQEASTKLPDYSLVIVGDGQDRHDLMNLTRELGIEDRVVFTGQQSQQEIVRLLNESALFVMSSVSEGFPKVILEALACGLPVVVTDVGNSGDVVRDNGVGIVVPPNQPSSLAQAVVTMLTDKRRYRECAKRCELTADKYDWAEVARIVAEEYDRLLYQS